LFFFFSSWSRDQLSMSTRDDECPLCCEDFSIQDKNFKPCQCGYQVLLKLFFEIADFVDDDSFASFLLLLQICMWCWHHIKNDLNGLCPNCRSPWVYHSKQAIFILLIITMFFFFMPCFM
jgi:DNA-directed RNA polymerase subunit RPC12/RpoP